MSFVLVDSSSWTQALRRKGDEQVRKRVLGLVTSGRAVWCDMVRLELWNGAQGDPEKQRLSDFDRILDRLPIDDQVWDEACRIARQARENALTVPNADLVIIACARRHNAMLDHCDQHFDRLAKLLGD